MTDPETMLAWMDRKIWSAATWLETFGKGAKKQRPELDIAAREEDIRMLTELRGAYEEALERKRSAEASGAAA